MTIKQELQNQNNRLDKCRRKLAAAEQRSDADMAAKFSNEIQSIEENITKLKTLQDRVLSDKSAKIQTMKYSRALTKAEQADMGKLKKAVKGLIVVHPMTAQGREMNIKVVTGFAQKEF